jgi:hypothetical protein
MISPLSGGVIGGQCHHETSNVGDEDLKKFEPAPNSTTLIFIPSNREQIKTLSGTVPPAVIPKFFAPVTECPDWKSNVPDLLVTARPEIELVVIVQDRRLEVERWN